jgi:transcriptional regulator with XRE-family HTH domain
MPKRGRPKGRSSDSRSYGPLGDLIRSHRLEKGLGLADVAQACACSVQFISNIEHGRAPLPWEKAQTLAACLGISIETLQAANLSVRSDFKSFMGTAAEGDSIAAQSAQGGRARGALVKGRVLRLGQKSIAPPQANTDPAQALTLAMAAKDADFRVLIEAYQAASLSARRKFVRSALKLLQAE